jgi:hypothetical protein
MPLTIHGTAESAAPFTGLGLHSSFDIFGQKRLQKPSFTGLDLSAKKPES